MTVESEVVNLTNNANALFEQINLLIDKHSNGGQTQTFFISPDGAGDGSTEAEPTKLAVALERLSPATLNILKLSSGEHISNNQTVTNISNIIFEPWNLNPTNLPVICSPGTTAGQASEACSGSPQPSLNCGAHDHKETGLTLRNCPNVVINNINFKGTTAALACYNSQVLLSGDVKFSVWVPLCDMKANAVYLEGSTMFSHLESHIRFAIYHGAYSAVPTSYMAPVMVRHASSLFLQKDATVFYNTQLDEALEKLTAIQVRTLSNAFINTLEVCNMGLITDTRKGSFTVGVVKASVQSQPLWGLASVENEGTVSFGGNGLGINWPAKGADGHISIKGDKAIRAIQNSSVTVTDGVRVSYSGSTDSMFLALNGTSSGHISLISLYGFNVPIFSGSCSTINAFNCTFDNSGANSQFSASQLASITLSEITLTGAYSVAITTGANIITPDGVLH